MTTPRPHPLPGPRHVHPQGVQPGRRRLTRIGISVKGSRVLEVRGRTSGELRTHAGQPAHRRRASATSCPRGETQWVRNLRAAEGSAARRPPGRDVRRRRAGRRRQAAILRPYLRRGRGRSASSSTGSTPTPLISDVAAAAPASTRSSDSSPSPTTPRDGRDGRDQPVRTDRPAPWIDDRGPPRSRPRVDSSRAGQRPGTPAAGSLVQGERRLGVGPRS